MIAAILQFFSSLLEALPVFLKITKFKIKTRRSKYHFQNFLLKQDNIQYLIYELRLALNCDRVLFIKTSNGGDVPKMGEPLYITILDESYSDTVGPIKKDYQKFEVDSSYKRLMLELIDKKAILMSPEDMEDSVLKTIFLANKIDKVLLRSIQTYPKLEFAFLSIQWREKDDIKLNMDELTSKLTTFRHKIKSEYDVIKFIESKT